MSIFGNPVMMGGSGGEGGSTNILSGVTPPSSSQGSNGAIYLQYKGPVPTGYTFIDYLEFVNGSYIDLNIVPSNHKLLMVADDYQYVNDKHWFGTTAGSKYYHFTPYNNRYYWGNNGAEGNASLAWSSGKKTLVFNGDDNEKTLDGTVLDSGTFSASTASLMIAKRDTSANAAYFRVYSVKLWDKTSGDLVRDMAPVKRISDDALGLYDLANDVFYPNSGTGTFIAGEELAERAIVASQAKVSGAWQDLIGTSVDDIDLGGGGGDGSHNYSTTEQVVGTWIDGKPIYELTVITSDRTYNVEDLAIDLLIFADGYGSDSSGYNGNKWTYTAVTNNASRLIYLSSDRKTLYLNGSYYQYGFTIQYTKTTDQAVS